jgi:hypothetical protein
MDVFAPFIVANAVVKSAAREVSRKRARQDGFVDSIASSMNDDLISASIAYPIIGQDEVVHSTFPWL